jgi:hypothetical protein
VEAADGGSAESAEPVEAPGADQPTLKALLERLT